MDSVMRKIIDQFEFHIDQYIHQYIETCPDFAGHSAEEKEADAFQLFEMITDHPGFKNHMLTWAAAMHENYLSYGQLARIDDDSAEDAEYTPFINWYIVNRFISDAMM